MKNITVLCTVPIIMTLVIPEIEPIIAKTVSEIFNINVIKGAIVIVNTSIEKFVDDWNIE